MQFWEEAGKELIHKSEESEKFFAKVGSEKFAKYKAHKRLGYVFEDNDKLILKHYEGKTELNILEIGSFLGQGSKFFIKVFENSGFKPHVDSVDLMLPYLEEGSDVDYSSQGFYLLKNTQQERKQHKLVLHSGRSRDILPHLSKTFDFAYVDGEHTPGGVYLDLVLTLGKSRKGTLILVDDMTWYDLKSVAKGVETFMSVYKGNIAKSYAHGEHEKKFGFHEIDSVKELKKVKTDQILFEVLEPVERSLEQVLEEIKKHRLHLNTEFNAGRRGKTLKLKRSR
jgi:hypothetical protein